MNTTLKILTYELRDVLRGKWIVVYALLFLLITDTLFRFGGDAQHVLISLMNVVLTVIPLFSIIFGSLYLYNSREFIELLLSQPINRKQLFIGMYTGIALPLVLGFVAGILIPFIYSGQKSENDLWAVFILLASGTALTLIFLAVSFLISVVNEDRIKGLGMAILLWLFFTVIYDGLVLALIYIFGDYPLERFVLFLSFLNPVDLGRVLLLMEFDVSALMGYTGAVFQNFFGSSTGTIIAAVSLIMWITLPLYFALRRFEKKDL
ncbi:MAG: hypothetical protein E4H13_03605 [Calditrichales bacterium]|nr:MAG: hypothetical protein E4H13_03605 [Calditrichales bacterium]